MPASHGQPILQGVRTVTLSDRRLLLRPFAPADIPAVYEACQDPDIERWTSIQSPYRHSDAEMFVSELVPAGWAAGTEATFGVFERESGRLAGSLGLMHITPEGSRDGRMAEVGFWAVKEMRGRGYLTDAVRLVCRWAFDELHVMRVEWYAEVGNEPSRRVAEKVGFVFEGTLRSRLVHGRQRRDAWLASLLPADLT
jgi:RimJ/RimL family protein N-acetyltransferase